MTTLGEGWGTEGFANTIGTVISSQFVEDKYGTQLVWKLQTDQAPPFDERTIYIGLGKGWETPDGGKTMQHPTRTKPHESSLYGRLIKTVLNKEIGGADDLLAELGSRGKDQNHADVWEGLTFEFENEEYESRNPTTGETKQKKRFFPVKYLSNGVKAAAPSYTLDELMNDVEAKAAEATSYEQFVALAIDIPGVDTNQTLLDQIMDDSDKGLYAQLKG